MMQRLLSLKLSFQETTSSDTKSFAPHLANSIGGASACSQIQVGSSQTALPVSTPDEFVFQEFTATQILVSSIQMSSTLMLHIISQGLILLPLGVVLASLQMAHL